MNDAKFRKQRRLTGYVDPEIKRQLLSEAKEAGRSMSLQMNITLGRYYQRLSND